MYLYQSEDELLSAFTAPVSTAASKSPSADTTPAPAPPAKAAAAVVDPDQAELDRAMEMSIREDEIAKKKSALDSLDDVLGPVVSGGGGGSGGDDLFLPSLNAAPLSNTGTGGGGGAGGAKKSKPANILDLYNSNNTKKTAAAPTPAAPAAATTGGDDDFDGVDFQSAAAQQSSTAAAVTAAPAPVATPPLPAPVAAATATADAGGDDEWGTEFQSAGATATTTTPPVASVEPKRTTTAPPVQAQPSGPVAAPSTAPKEVADVPIPDAGTSGVTTAPTNTEEALVMLIRQERLDEAVALHSHMKAKSEAADLKDRIKKATKAAAELDDDSQLELAIQLKQKLKSIEAAFPTPQVVAGWMNITPPRHSNTPGAAAAVLAEIGGSENKDRKESSAPASSQPLLNYTQLLTIIKCFNDKEKEQLFTSKFPQTFAAIANGDITSVSADLLNRALNTQRMANAFVACLVGPTGADRTRCSTRFAAAAQVIHAHLSEARDFLNALASAQAQAQSPGPLPVGSASLTRAQTYLTAVMEMYRIGVRLNRSRINFQLPATAQLRFVWHTGSLARSFPLPLTTDFWFDVVFWVYADVCGAQRIAFNLE